MNKRTVLNAFVQEGDDLRGQLSFLIQIGCQLVNDLVLIVIHAPLIIKSVIHLRACMGWVEEKRDPIGIFHE
jgi:hypothetical protein